MAGDRELYQQAYDALKQRATDGRSPVLKRFLELDSTLHTVLSTGVVQEYLHILNVLTPPLMSNADVQLYRTLHIQLEEHHQVGAEWRGGEHKT